MEIIKLNKWYILLTVLIAGFINVVQGAQAVLSPPQTLFTNVKVFNGTDNKLSNVDVLVEGNLIKAIGKKVKGRKDATVIDGGGCTLMPGLIEMHVHYSTFLPLSTWAKDSLHPYAHGSLAILRANEFLMNGYTTTRDAGGPSKYLRDIIDAGLAPGPD